MAEKWRTDLLKSYSECVRYRLDVGEGVILRPIREAIAETGIDNAKLHTLDRITIGSVVVGEYMDPRLLDDDPNQPLNHWWWHLGALRAGSFPLDQLPEHLVVVYYEATQNLAQVVREQADEVQRTIALGASGFRTIRFLLRDGKPDEALELAEVLHNLPMPDDEDYQLWTRRELEDYLDTHPERRIFLAIACLDYWPTER